MSIFFMREQTFLLSGHFWRAFPFSDIQEKLFLKSLPKTLHKFQVESSLKTLNKLSLPKTKNRILLIFRIQQKFASFLNLKNGILKAQMHKIFKRVFNKEFTKIGKFPALQSPALWTNSEMFRGPEITENLLPSHCPSPRRCILYFDKCRLELNRHFKSDIIILL